MGLSGAANPPTLGFETVSKRPLLYRMKIVLLAVGRLRSVPLREVCEDYLSRLKRYGPAEVREVKASDAEPAAAIKQESGRLNDALEPNDYVYVLDERGAQLTSVELSQALKTHELRAVKRLVFVLGGAYGLDETIRRRGKLFALSKMTLPHELCRALILEQIYRARTIQHGEPYHHA
jgi:23S rRNA (pseudouridine1915-N3)-methyltransferase